MTGRWVRIAAIAVAMMLLAVACSSHKKSKKPSSKGETTTSLGSRGAPVTYPPGTPVTKPGGTPVTKPGGTPVTYAPGTPVSLPLDPNVTNPDETSTSTPGNDGSSTTTSRPRGGTSTTTTTVPKPPPTGPRYYLRWKFAYDFRAHPNLNPFPDYKGGPPVWSLRESQGLQRDGNYSMLPTYSAAVGSAGIAAWHANSSGCHQAPEIGVSLFDAPGSVCGASVPGNAAFVYPAKTLMPVVAWTSNFPGTVTITAAISDFDGACGDGVSYYIDRGTTNLTTVRLTNNDSRVLPLITTNISPGESLYFIVDSGPAGNNACDATQLQIQIDRINT